MNSSKCKCVKELSVDELWRLAYDLECDCEFEKEFSVDWKHHLQISKYYDSRLDEVYEELNRRGVYNHEEDFMSYMIGEKLPF